MGNEEVMISATPLCEMPREKGVKFLAKSDIIRQEWSDGAIEKSIRVWNESTMAYETSKL